MLRLLKWVRHHFELGVWVTGLIALYCMPAGNDHFSLCVFNALGFTWCPGCGIGHSIHYYLHMDFVRGWEEHYLGALAVPVILYRVFQLPKQFISNQKISYV